MESFIYFFIHLGIPILVLISLLRQSENSKLGMVLSMTFKMLILIFLFFWGQYSLVGLYYLRYILLLLMLFSIWKAFQLWTRDLDTFPKGWIKYVVVISVGVLSCLLLMLTFYTVKGVLVDKTPTQDLVFPLRNGNYYISSGGTTKIVNNHFRSYPNSQQYAIDINKINATGSVSANIFSNKSDNHFIYGEELYCPCNGIVLVTQNDVSDNLDSNMQVDHNNGRGNYIEIDCNGLIVTMMHLQEGSVKVSEGITVNVGQPIAKVGNSGFSMEPHLHIQAAKYNDDSVLIGEPVSFDGQWLVRNDLIIKN